MTMGTTTESTVMAIISMDKGELKKPEILLLLIFSVRNRFVSTRDDRINPRINAGEE